MRKKEKAAAIIKLLKKGMTPIEITQRMDASYNYAWKLKKDLEKAAQAALGMPCTNECEPKHEPEVEVKAAGVDAILNERAGNYGSFATQARIAQRLKHVAHTAAGEQGKTFATDQAEALDMIFSKIGRILNGNPDHVDSWVDIAGYAQLVADRLQGKVR
jgi:hypothetical protein